MISAKKKYVVFEDFEKATGSKVHSTSCYYYKRWLTNPTTTTTWHGPYATITKARGVCRELCRGTNFEPRDHSCVSKENLLKKEFRIEFRIDNSKASKIARVLFDEFYSKKGFFKDKSMPEYVLPRNLKEGTRQHALYLTYVVSIDYMVDAEKLWKKSRGAYELYPERFTPERIRKVSQRSVEFFVKKIGARYYKNAAKTWKKISEILLAKYDGDPRNITPEPIEIAEVKKHLKAFPYLRGNKLSNFYIRVMGETGLFKLKNLNELDIPVDKQVARFTLYTGVLKLLSESFIGCAQDEPLRGLIEEAWRNAAQALNTAPWKLDEPIWTVGSKLCSGRKCGQCPVEDLCDKTKGITFKENTVVWKRE